MYIPTQALFEPNACAFLYSYVCPRTVSSVAVPTGQVSTHVHLCAFVHIGI